jgi:hypothetical protein
MKNSRLRRYLQQKAVAKNSPIVNKQEIQSNPDKHIDQDFEGYPHGPAKEEVINPKTKNQRKSAAVNTKDGEKMIGAEDKKKTSLSEKEEASDGSANAFEGTETVTE